MKRWLCLVLALAAALALAACGKQEAPEASAAEPENIRIGMLFDTFVVERWQRDRDIFVSTAQELGAEVTVQSANGDVAEQEAQMKAMQFTDEALRRFSFIDPARLGVTGGSYGGFMTNWIIGHTNRFAAAASQRSIANWTGFFGTSDIGYFFQPDQTKADLWRNAEKAWDQSPLKYADRVSTPTLFIHSDEDWRCPLFEGLQMFTALRVRGVETRLCLFRGENHELSRSGKPKHRVRRLQEITGWMETHLGQPRATGV